MMNRDVREKLKGIQMIIMDVDGTLTDGKIYMGSKGEEFKTFHVRDGYGIVKLKKKGIIPVFLSGRKSEAVQRRAEELGVQEVYQGIEDKKSIFIQLQKKYSLTEDQIACIGDDLNDLSILKMAGVKFTVTNCSEPLRNFCDYVANAKGGEGAVREIIDMIIGESTKE